MEKNSSMEFTIINQRDGSSPRVIVNLLQTAFES
jgi:hypothetical protein